MNELDNPPPVDGAVPEPKGTSRALAWINRDESLPPALVQLAGLLVIFIAVVYVLATGKLLTPLLATGGTLIGFGQYLKVVEDIRAMLREQGRREGLIEQKAGNPPSSQ